MIEVFKIAHGIYDLDVSPKLAYQLGSITRGNKHKLFSHRFHYDLQKHYFFLHAFLTSGIAYQIMSLMLTLSTCARHA